MPKRLTPPRDSPPDSSRSLTPDNEADADADADTQHAENCTAQNPRLGKRRGHFKSRLGCLNCKRRRVKCNEARPECSPCRRLGLTCEYPATYALAAPRANPSPLNLQDLRFYHQFLSVASPPLPLREPSVWSQCAAMSHDNEGLAHAILGLGASHISQNSEPDYTARALHHRVIAIKHINDELSRPITDPARLDALYASIFCLVTQAALMPDSMMEYFTMTRGIYIVSRKVIESEVWSENTVSLFDNMHAEGHIKAVTALVEEMDKDYDLADAFKQSVLRVQDKCTAPAELRYIKGLVAPVDALNVSSLEAWKGFAWLYMMSFWLTNDEYAAFLAPDNYVAQLLVAHMMLLDYVLGPSCLSREKEPQSDGRKHVVISWVRKLADKLPGEYAELIRWPLEFCDAIENETKRRFLMSP